MQTELLNVLGMTCGECTTSVANALKAVRGVAEVEVSLSSGVATVKYDESQTALTKLHSAVTAAGYALSLGRPLANRESEQ